MLKQFYEKNKLEVGLDEAGRGCLLGPVCVAGVIWLDEDPNHKMVVKDSKKCSKKYREKCYQYILENCISYSIKLLSNEASLLSTEINGNVLYLEVPDLYVFFNKIIK